MPPAAIGSRCELLSLGPSGSLRSSIKRYGEIAYIGTIEGLPGDGWLGVRLDKPLGKGDGSFQGRRYFDCKPLHGAIVRPERVNTNGVFPKLTTHEESLAHALEERRKEKQELNRELTTDELATAFWEKLTQQEAHIRKQVGVFCEQKKQPLPCDPAKEVKLDALVLEVNAMRDAAATASSLYLSPYDTRHTQLILSKLLELIDTTRTTFAPRKKFTFRARAAKRAKAIKLVHANKQNEVIVIDSSSFAHTDDSRRRDLNFSHLSDCAVLVCVETSAIRGDALKNCVFYTGAIFGSLWLENCNGCEFFVACRQLRVHLSTATTFYLRIPSHPIIEDCQQIQFGPYRLQFEGLKAQLERLGVSKDSGLWAKVNDFKWHKAQQSPNWSIRDPKQPLPKIPVKLEKLISYD
ncbi:tubulin-specific chaperone C, putative [Phytophthora infestans T30-4]|uniref:Tubulin-specific chaperone C, putative n=1 Tax=Phytophthora infestans (strain T30-4) TaxID=403677 RepID=D0NQP6_PHYIT|nr:tubulin-specific chaperone C, putative [Phytophthora infestans T30-4]EEY62994.1 tubulin-specific chaperone C, putative [Phytophthora infestans T30-4]|eukprot:XP_002898517.1 tubulin-specific chaperone C, putative [Phytophthora infestans T30-4]